MNKKFLNAVLFGALLASSTGTFTSCKDYDDDIKGLQEQIDANNKTLDEKLATLQTAMEKAKADITAANAAAAAAQAAAEKAQATGDAAKIAAAKAEQAAAAAAQAAADAKRDAIAEATRLVNELKAVVEKKVDQSVYNAKMGVIDAHLGVIDGKLSNLEAADIAIRQQITTLENFKRAIDALNLTEAFPELQSKVATLISDLGTLSGKVSQNTTDIATVRTDLNALSDRLDVIEGQLSTIGTNLNTLTALLSQRLTALTFAPSEFINGIEVINFATLQYTSWDNLLADNANGSAYSINDGKTTAVYYASPSSVKKANIKSLSILTQDATNTTRAAGEIITATLNQEIVAGKMIVNLKKNTTESFNKNKDQEGKEHFTLLALRADIELTAEEVAKGVKPTVISDWARLAETATTPYIHNKDKYPTTDPVENLDNAVIPHFYPYKKIHDGNTGAVCSTEGKYIIKDVPYTESVDLMSLVDVCDKKNHRYTLTDYNMAFEFALVDYKLQAASEEEQNQKLFARIVSEDGILKLKSQARNGALNNRDAIGREPMVQIVLKDKTNDKVVDVRYFKIKWTAENKNEYFDKLGEFTGTFNSASCNNAYTNNVGEVGMNRIYTKLNIEKEVFHKQYELDGNVYATAEEAKVGTPTSTKLGTIKDVAAPGSTMTHNIEWKLPIANYVITPAEYTAGTATRTVYGRYINKVDASLSCTFELKLVLTIEKMSFIAGYLQSSWNEGATLSNTNKEKTFLVNPALTSDQNYGIAKFYDCQIIASMLEGYNIDGKTITAPKDLVSKAQNAKFIFDNTRLSTLGTGWTISTDGTQLLKGGKVAASIDANGVIRLHENPLPTLNAHGVPTAEARLLLGKTVPVKLIASYCNGASGELSAELDQFLVKFINPLEITLAEVQDSFQDLITGGSVVSIKNIASIKETFGLKRTVWENGQSANSTLVQWYDVKNVTWNLEGAKTNLKKDGNNIIITTDPYASDWSEFADKYNLSADTSDGVNATKLTFQNRSGAALQQDIQIAVPVFAATKWSLQLEAANKYVVLTVKKGATK